jgi:hypothetical protein
MFLHLSQPAMESDMTGLAVTKQIQLEKFA